MLWVTRQPQHADQPPIEHQRQVDPRLHAFEALGGVCIQLDDPAIGQYQLRTFVAGVDAPWLTTAQDQPLAVHDIDIARQNGHCPIDNILRQVMVQFEHSVVLEGIGFWSRAGAAQATLAQEARSWHTALSLTNAEHAPHEAWRSFRPSDHCITLSSQASNGSKAPFGEYS
ncbi:hypothetical protein D3C73_919020 [compost metagenome]